MLIIWILMAVIFHSLVWPSHYLQVWAQRQFKWKSMKIRVVIDIESLQWLEESKYTLIITLFIRQETYLEGANLLRQEGEIVLTYGQVLQLTKLTWQDKMFQEKTNSFVSPKALGSCVRLLDCNIIFLRSRNLPTSLGILSRKFSSRSKVRSLLSWPKPEGSFRRWLLDKIKLSSEDNLGGMTRVSTTPPEFWTHWLLTYMEISSGILVSWLVARFSSTMLTQVPMSGITKIVINFLTSR